MKPLIPLVLLLLGACALPAPEPGDPDEAAPEFGEPGEASYHLFMAEIALQRELPALAATEYLRAARASDDPEVAARATQVISSFGTEAEGLEAAQRWAALAPDDLDARRFLVRFRLAAGDVSRASRELAVLRAAAGEATEPRPFLGLLPLVTDAADPQAAVAAMAAVVAEYPQDPSGAYAQAYLALRAGELELARSEAKRAVDLAPEWTEAAILYGRTLVAAERVDEALEWLAARPEAGERRMELERAVTLIAADRSAAARVVLESLLETDPADFEALRALGYLEYFEGRTEVAREIFLGLLAAGRYPNDALFYLGGIAEQQGEIEEAARLYSRIDGGEHLVTAQVRLALLMFRLGRPELALNHLEIFARHNPGADVDLGSARAELLARMGRSEEALALYDELLARHPDAVNLRYARGLMHVESGDVAAALEDFRHLATLYPDDPSALNAYGYTLADLTERHAEAYELIRRAFVLDPDSPAILDSMGWVLFKLGRPEEGLPYMARSWDLQRDPEIAAHLGELLWSLGRVDEARDIWLEAIVEWPGNPVLLDTMGRLDP